MDPSRPHRSSFRDPSGFVFTRNGTLFRQVNPVYREHYQHLMESGLYSELTRAGLLIPHEETQTSQAASQPVYRVIRPQRVPFVSYPYEWCFSQLKQAALTTLQIQKHCLEHDMSLKDASAYNIQFQGCRPILIDTLSFEKYRPGQPWAAYRQFCRHFLAPLALMAFKDVRLHQLLRVHIDGIPLDLASRLLPLRTRFRFALLVHIHLHARSQRHFADKPRKSSGRQMSRLALTGLIDNLRACVGKLKWTPRRTEWVGYYADTNYSERAFEHKQRLVEEFLSAVRPRTVWDLGANTGVFSGLAGAGGARCVAFDLDPAAVERHYLDLHARDQDDILPLLLDLTNPSASLGWDNAERMSWSERGTADTVMALALIHHLCISNNVPLDILAGFFEKICSSLIIEFVPKDDSQVQRLLASRQDIFPDYTREHFEAAFSRHFSIRRSETVADSERHLYLMVKE